MALKPPSGDGSLNTQSKQIEGAQGWLASIFARPPFIGLFPFAVFFLSQGLGHAVMIQVEHSMGAPGMYYAAGAMGLLGAVLLWFGMRQESEVSGTWLGYFAAWLLWTGWVEFSFVYYARWLGVAPLLDAAGEVATKPEYLVMMSSLGVMLATLVYFLFNRETRCNFFRWFHRRLGLGTGKPTEGHKRNFAAITALETIYLIWFFYLFLLIIYDENVLGDTHPVTFGIAALNAVWAVYLLRRLLRFRRVATALRYSIATAIISWNAYEFVGRWGWVGDFFVQPDKYGWEIMAVGVASLLIVVLCLVMPAGKKERERMAVMQQELSAN